MNRRDALFTGGAAALTLGAADVAEAATLTSVNVTESGSLQRKQPGWPVPRDANQVMYMQRSMNPNTVVWAARFDNSGNLGSPPAHAFWRRYNTGGEIKALGPLERRFAFGLNIGPGGQPGRYTVAARAVPQFKFLLVQTGPGQAQAWCRLGGKSVIADHVYLVMQGSVKVTDMFAYGRDPQTGRYITEHFRVTGGALR